MLTAKEEAPLFAEDRLAIHELIARNYLVKDTRDEADLAAIVTEAFKQGHVVFGATGAATDWPRCCATTRRSSTGSATGH